MDLVKELAEFKGIEKTLRDDGNGFIYLWKSLDGIRIEFKPNYFADEGFESFALFQSGNFVERQVLENYEDRWLEVYCESIDQEICEVRINNELDGKHIILFTPIHVFPQDYVKMWQALSSQHLEFHRKARSHMESKKLKDNK